MLPKSSAVLASRDIFDRSLRSTSCATHALQVSQDNKRHMPAGSRCHGGMQAVVCSCLGNSYGKLAPGSSVGKPGAFARKAGDERKDAIGDQGGPEL
jgi:hypothetical protein